MKYATKTRLAIVVLAFASALCYTSVVTGQNPLQPPTSLSATVVGLDDDDVELTWNAPNSGSTGCTWLHWDDSTNFNGIGLTTGGTYFGASRWETSDLVPYHGMYLSKIHYFQAIESPTAVFNLMVWVGANANTLVLTQPVTNNVINNWNTINLQSPVLIDSIQELWFGFEVTHPQGEEPAGVDPGPAVAGKGDLLSLDGSTWVSMSIEYNMDYNWNLQGCVSEDADGSVAKPMTKKIPDTISAALFTTGTPKPSVRANHRNTSEKSKELLGYNIYRDGILIASETETTYLDEDLPAGTYAYYVTALYDEGESVPSNIDSVYISDFDYCDDFENYFVGQQLVVQNPTDWTTWSGTAGNAEDPFIVDNGGNVVEITGTNDLVFEMPDYTSGFYIISFDMFIPTGGDAYFNTLQQFDGAASAWGMQVYFGETNLGEGNIDGGGALAQLFTFDYDTWMSVKVMVDLDNDWAEFYLDENLIHGWVWSSGTFGTGTLNQLGGNNFYAWDGGAYGNPLYHIDNYCINFPQYQFTPVQNLTGLFEPPDDVMIHWDLPGPGTGTLQGYSVYRDGVEIASLPVSVTEYFDEDLFPGVYEYCVEAVYDEGVSSQECILVVVPSFPPPLPVPANLVLSVSGDSVVVCWDMYVNQWMRWDAGVNNGNGVGLTEGGTFSVASHWDPASLSPFNGFSLQKISFFAHDDPNASYTLKIWIGANGLTEILSQNVPDFVVNDWNAITLNTPIEIISSNHLWFGYEVSHSAGTQPAGCDDGPAVTGYGDMIFMDGEWIPLSDLNPQLNYNWNLAANVVLSKGEKQIEYQLIAPHATSGDCIGSGSSGFTSKFVAKDSKGLAGFNIYYSLDGSPYTLLGFTEETCFTHVGAANIYGLHCYSVSAVFDPEGESDMSEEACVMIGSTDENEEKDLILYPNPAHHVVQIESGQQIQAIEIYNSVGQRLRRIEIDNTNYSVNTSDFNSGIYHFRIFVNGRAVCRRIIIK